MRVMTDALLQAFGQYGLTADHIDEVRKEAVDECLLIFHFILSASGLPVEHLLKLEKTAEVLLAVKANQLTEDAMIKMRGNK